MTTITITINDLDLRKKRSTPPRQAQRFKVQGSRFKVQGSGFRVLGCAGSVDVSGGKALIENLNCLADIQRQHPALARRQAELLAKPSCRQRQEGVI